MDFSNVPLECMIYLKVELNELSHGYVKSLIKQLMPLLRAKKFYEWILDQDQSTLKKEIPSVKWVSATGKVGCIVVGFEFTDLSLQQCP